MVAVGDYLLHLTMMLRARESMSRWARLLRFVPSSCGSSNGDWRLGSVTHGQVRLALCTIPIDSYDESYLNKLFTRMVASERKRKGRK